MNKFAFSKFLVTSWFIVAFTSHSWAKAPPCKNGSVLESSNNKVTYAKINDPIGFCSNHASRDLLHQEICKRAKDPKDCFQPAIADFLIADKKLNPADRNSDLALREVLARNKIASEECLKFNNLFPAAKKEKRYVHYGEKFSSVGRNVAMRACLDQGNSLASCNNQLNSPQFTEFLYDGISQWKDQKDCEEKDLPGLAFKHFRSDKDGLSPSENLNRFLKNGNFVKIATFDGEDPHSFVIANYRISCKQGRPVLEYQTIDSLAGTQWSDSKKMGDWMDGDELIEILDVKSGFLILDSAPTKPRNDNPSEAVR